MVGATHLPVSVLTKQKIGMVAESGESAVEGMSCDASGVNTWYVAPEGGSET